MLLIDILFNCIREPSQFSTGHFNLLMHAKTFCRLQLSEIEFWPPIFMEMPYSASWKVDPFLKTASSAHASRGFEALFSFHWILRRYWTHMGFVPTYKLLAHMHTRARGRTE